MKVLCIGEALIDMICTDRGSRLADGQNFLKKAGGAPANVAAAIAALGGQVDMAAKVGKDPFGQHLIDLLNTPYSIFYYRSAYLHTSKLGYYFLELRVRMNA